MRHAASGPAAGSAAARLRRAASLLAPPAALAGVALLAGCSGDDAGASGSDPGALEDGHLPDRPEIPAHRNDPMAAERLVRQLGCGACHRDLPAPDTARRRAPSLGSDGRPLPRSFVFEYLRSPRPQRPDLGRTRMPDFHLSGAEAAALTLYLDTTLPPASDGGDAEATATLREAHPGAEAEVGRRIFTALNCAGCHDGTDAEPWPAGPDLWREGERARPEWLAGWLARPSALRPFGFHPGTGSRMPDFRLSATEADTLAAYLSGRGRSGDPERAASGSDTGGAASAGPGAASVGRDAATEAAGVALSPYEAAKAERLLRRRLACLGCHRLGEEGGRVAPELTRVGERRPDAYVRAVVERPAETVPGTVMPPTPVSAETRELIVRYLTAGGGSDAGERGGNTGRGAAGAEDVPADEASAGRTSPAGAGDSGYLSLVDHPVRPPDPWMRQGADGPRTAAELYRHRCAACHGTDGGGDGYNARHLPAPPTVHADADSMADRTDARLFDGIHAGGRVLGRSARMPAFGGALSRDEIWGLVGRLRELCDCRGAAWYRDNDESGAPPRGERP